MIPTESPLSHASAHERGQTATQRADSKAVADPTGTASGNEDETNAFASLLESDEATAEIVEGVAAGAETPPMELSQKGANLQTAQQPAEDLIANDEPAARQQELSAEIAVEPVPEPVAVDNIDVAREQTKAPIGAVVANAAEPKDAELRQMVPIAEAPQLDAAELSPRIEKEAGAAIAAPLAISRSAATHSLPLDAGPPRTLPASPLKPQAPVAENLEPADVTLGKLPERVSPQLTESTNPAPNLPSMATPTTPAAPAQMFDFSAVDHFDFSPRVSHEPSALRVDTARAPTVQLPEARQIIGQVATAIVKSDGGKLDIRLDPPELGRLSVTLTGDNDTVNAVIATDRADTQDLLRRHADLLHRALRDAGYSDVTIDFSTSAEGDQRQDGSAADLNQHEQGVELTVDTKAYALNVTSTGLDIRL